MTSRNHCTAVSSSAISTCTIHREITISMKGLRLTSSGVHLYRGKKHTQFACVRPFRVLQHDVCNGAHRSKCAHSNSFSRHKDIHSQHPNSKPSCISLRVCLPPPPPHQERFRPIVRSAAHMTLAIGVFVLYLLDGLTANCREMVVWGTAPMGVIYLPCGIKADCSPIVYGAG